MATSLLDGIDFDDPDSWEITTVVKTLASCHSRKA